MLSEIMVEMLLRSTRWSNCNAQEELTLTLNSNFDLTQEDNILYKFNSVNGGIIIPRGTSIVGLDLRKTKLDQSMFLTQQMTVTKHQQSLELLVLVTSGSLLSLMVMRQVLVYTDPRDFSSITMIKTNILSPQTYLL